jgi:starvation-inducible DNA-binding protein
LHRLFDEFAAEVLETIDPLAERVRMIGQDPPAAPVEVADLASVAPAAPHANMRDMLEEADQNLLIVIKEMRAGAKMAEQNDDPGSVDIFSRLVQVHEKHEWFARDVLRKGDGLSS